MSNSFLPSSASNISPETGLDRWPRGKELSDDLGCWAVAHVLPRNEKALARECIKLNIGYYLPLYVKRARRRDNQKIRKSVLPLLPGYFPFVDRDRARLSIFETRRIVHILEVVDQAGFVRDLEAIRRVAASGLSILGIEQFAIGQLVRIKDGPLQGLTGIVREMKSPMRLLLNVEAVRLAVSVEIDSADVEPVRLTK